MAKANPPPHTRLPPEILKNRPLAGVLQKIIFDVFLLWRKTGGAGDPISDSETGLYEFDDLEKIDVRKELKEVVTVQSTDYTTFTSETVICTDAITVKLNAEPDDGEVIRVKITNGDVTIDGNGRNIDGDTSLVIDFSEVLGYPMIDLFYAVETDQWYVI